MKRSIKIFFEVKDDERSILFETFKIASKVFNDHIEWSFNKKSVSKAIAHKELYLELRQKYGTFPSALLQAMRDTALEAVKAIKFKFRPKKSERSSIRYDARTMSLRGDLMTISSVAKRIKVKLNFCEYHKNVVNRMIRSNGGIVGFDKRKEKFFVVFVYEKTDIDKKLIGKVVGIDRGIKNFVVTSDGNIYGNEIKRLKRKHTHLRQKLSAKGTRSAKRLLKKLSRKEKRFSRDVNHYVSKQLSNCTDVSVYILEDLKGISKNRKRNKKLNRWLCSWPFFQFETFLKYKCEETGIEIVKVDPRYTSQTCSSCGHVDRDNRHRSNFKCLRCDHHENADLNAAKNIRNKYMTSTLSTQGVRQSPKRMEEKSSRPRFQPHAGIN